MALGRGPTAALSACGIGFVPVAPGTAASLATTAAIYGTFHLAGATVALGLTALLVVYGCAASLRWAGLARGPDGGGDPGWVVADEVAGQAMALLVVPLELTGAVLATFVLFRAFDILKPGPIRRLERIPGGAGVLLDDLGAGMLAGVVVAALCAIEWLTM